MEHLPQYSHVNTIPVQDEPPIPVVSMHWRRNLLGCSYQEQKINFRLASLLIHASNTYSTGVTLTLARAGGMFFPHPW